MWEFISEVFYVLILTFSSLILLDYVFGIDKFKEVRNLLKTEYILEFIAGGVLLVLGTLHVIAHLYDSEMFKKLTTLYMCIIWGGVWIFHTVVNLKNGIMSFRNKNIQKRKKPQ